MARALHYEEHEAKSIEIATIYLNQVGYPNSKLIAITKCIEATKMGVAPRNRLAALMKDADIAFGILHGFKKIGDALRKEWMTLLNRQYSDIEWETIQTNFLKGLTFYSEYGQTHFRKIVDGYSHS